MAGDSTFWVASDADRVKVRRSPLLLTLVDGRFQELYLADTDHSFYDALVVGQRIYKRDLITGDSVMVLDDAVVSRVAQDYAASHPHERPLALDEETSEEPSVQATTDTELLDASGPFLTYEQHVDIDIAGERDQHSTRRGVIDLRAGRRIGVAHLVDVDQGRAILQEGRRLLASAVDSVRRARDERARRAVSALTGFVFDSTSFGLTQMEGHPAVAFLVPGQGPRAGGYSLPLPPIRIAPGPWWAEVRSTLASSAAENTTWKGGTYDVLAREDSSGETTRITVRVGPNEWSVARVPSPVRRVFRLDAALRDSAVVRALARAFDESSLYSGDASTAALPHASFAQPAPGVRAVARHVENSTSRSRRVSRDPMRGSLLMPGVQSAFFQRLAGWTEHGRAE
ncbi:MAG: hypothetical protein ABIZ91_19585 [Gemmatimonadaceae bacterium]